MPEEKDKWAKAMAERHTGSPEPKEPDKGSAEQVVSGSVQGNEEWRAFYEAIRAHVQGMRK
ncbi:hypothetical protein M3194_16900 [Paenibacillus glycanilyticus]|uniref:hypothetical protein n=1 Tax=Paenibacillus glycanilyticus TaxID=126569 RepID=UPI00203C1FC7|nr:hypothetical protein [Paenibacillus glycanilyticus]MCM3629027.1 hypothetical protein [Paenibacillus glycanilyticus]